MYYFIGIKGAGMSALATIMCDLGYEVSGSDIESYVFVQEALNAKNIPIYTFDKKNIKDGYNIIIGNAFNEKNNEEVVAAFSNSSCKVYYYHDFLNVLIEKNKSICVSGTHGKTTTTGLLYHVLSNYDKTMCLIGDGTGLGEKDANYFVVEACEYQDHFLAYHPDYAIITNLELDHVDYFDDIDSYVESFSKFSQNVKKKIVIYGDDLNYSKFKTTTNVITFGEGKHTNFRAENLVEDSRGIHFDLIVYDKDMGRFDLPFFGHHMLLNSLAVIAIAISEGMMIEDLKNALTTFPGVKRRFNVEEIGQNVFIDDYAHHPTAIATTIKAVKQRFPNKEIVAIFKPDRFSRIYHLADKFAESLASADYVYLFDFPKNAVKEKGIDITVDYLGDMIEKSKVITEDESGLKVLAEHENVVYLFMSSKDVYTFAGNLKKVK